MVRHLLHLQERQTQEQWPPHPDARTSHLPSSLCRPDCGASLRSQGCACASTTFLSPPQPAAPSHPPSHSRPRCWFRQAPPGWWLPLRAGDCPSGLVAAPLGWWLPLLWAPDRSEFTKLLSVHTTSVHFTASPVLDAAPAAGMQQSSRPALPTGGNPGGLPGSSAEVGSWAAGRAQFSDPVGAALQVYAQEELQSGGRERQ